MHAPSVITYQSCGFDKKRQVSNETCLFLVYPLGFCRFRFAEPRQSVGASLLARTVASHLYSRIQKTPHVGVFWCTRWGSNPDSTASEAVMLSNYTTSTYLDLIT